MTSSKTNSSNMISLQSSFPHTQDELHIFKKVQRIAYDAAEYTRQHLEEGMTEKEACKIMRDYLEKRDIRQFFHLPFAWFGKRAAFENFSIPLNIKTHQFTKIHLPSLSEPLPHFGREFMPSNTKLEKGMSVILDVAPTIDGHTADIGLAFSFGENEKVDKARQDLLLFRDLILKGAKSQKLMSEIYHDCDLLMQKLGYSNCHSLYPLGVLGHQVGRLPFLKMPKISFLGFHAQAYAFLLQKRLGKIRGTNSNAGVWTHDSKVKLSPGIWAVEPHIAVNGIGVKFEELLVVTENDAYWLDDDLPHLKI